MSDTIHSKLSNYQNTVNSININDTKHLGTNSVYLNHYHGHIITGNVGIIKNS